MTSKLRSAVLVCAAATFITSAYTVLPGALAASLTRSTGAWATAILAALRCVLCAAICALAGRLFPEGEKPALRAKPTTIALGALCGALVQVAAAAFAALADGALVFGVRAAPGDASSLIAFAAAVAVTPVCEELIFRGAILRALRTAFPAWASVLLSALCFALIHVAFSLRSSPFFSPTVIAAFVCGAILAVSVCRRGSLAPAIAFHAAFNLTSYFAGYIPLSPAIAAAIFAPLATAATILFLIKLPKGNHNETL